MNTVMSVLSNGFVTHLAAGAAGAIAVWWSHNRAILSNTVTQLKADVAALKGSDAPKTTPPTA